MALTNIKIKQAQSKDRPYKMADAGGIFLYVHNNGSKYFRLKYRFIGKEKVLALGVYPQTSLLEARTKAEEARKLINNNIDPSQEKKRKKG